MLKQQQYIGNARLLTQLDQRFLQMERSAVVDNAEMEDSDGIHQALRPVAERRGSAEAARKIIIYLLIFRLSSAWPPAGPVPARRR
jgi:hypothetical protein